MYCILYSTVLSIYNCSGHHLVRVRAQVMMREDSTGGWVPLGGGGLSHVAVRKRKIHHEDDPPCKHEYLIYGKRINDQKVRLVMCGDEQGDHCHAGGDELHHQEGLSVQQGDANFSPLEDWEPQIW